DGPPESLLESSGPRVERTDRAPDARLDLPGIRPDEPEARRHEPVDLDSTEPDIPARTGILSLGEFLSGGPTHTEKNTPERSAEPTPDHSPVDVEPTLDSLLPAAQSWQQRGKADPAVAREARKIVRETHDTEALGRVDVTLRGRVENVVAHRLDTE